jgi:hypothetical protein
VGRGGGDRRNVSRADAEHDPAAGRAGHAEPDADGKPDRDPDAGRAGNADRDPDSNPKPDGNAGRNPDADTGGKPDSTGDADAAGLTAAGAAVRRGTAAPPLPERE